MTTLSAMTWVALVFFTGVVAANAAIYLHHKGQLANAGPEERSTYILSAPTRFFGYLKIPYYFLVFGHLLVYVWFHPEGPSPLFLGLGLTTAVAALILLDASLRALGRNFAACNLGLMPFERVRSGPYRFLSHPIYVANLVMTAGIAVSTPGLLIVLAGTLLATFYVFAIRDEERALSAVAPVRDSSRGPSR